MNVQKAVAESYVHLANTSGPEPSISNVLNKAGVAEQDFYDHFSNLEEVSLLALEEMLWMIEGSNMPQRLDEGDMGPVAAQSICDDIVARISDAWLPTTAAVRHHRAVAQLAVGRAIQHRCAAYFAAFPAFRRVDQAYLDTASHYVGHGLAGIVAAWAAGDLVPDQGTVSNHMAQLLPAWLTDPKSIPVR